MTVLKKQKTIAPCLLLFLCMIDGTWSIVYGFSEDGQEARAVGGGPVLAEC